MTRPPPTGPNGSAPRARWTNPSTDDCVNIWLPASYGRNLSTSVIPPAFCGSSELVLMMTTMLCTMNSNRLGTSISTATAAVWLRSSAAYASPDRANSVVNSTSPTAWSTRARPVGRSRPKTSRQTRAMTTHSSATTAATTAVEIALAANTCVRFGIAVSVARIMPWRYSWPIENTPSSPTM